MVLYLIYDISAENSAEVELITNLVMLRVRTGVYNKGSLAYYLKPPFFYH